MHTSDVIRRLLFGRENFGERDLRRKFPATDQVYDEELKTSRLPEQRGRTWNVEIYHGRLLKKEGTIDLRVDLRGSPHLKQN